MKYKTILLTLVSLLMLACNRAPKSVCTPDRQAGAVIALIGRVVGPEHAGAFEVNVTGVQKDGKDYFALYGHDGRIVLEGNDGVSAASALKYYLERYCNCQITWCGTNLDLPEELPVPADRTERTSPYKYRYYLNYCTFNYTMSWWDEARWQREIDFMALNGINMPLAVTGQNSVWQRVYRKLGFSDDDLKDFFSGPAYFNWFWMGNLDGWGGPLPQSFIDRHEELQRFILHGERALGMTPVLPAFTGHVPPAFVKKFPDAAVRKTSWVEFPEVCILDPDEELFTRIGSMFIEEQTRLYGTNHLYSADTFNENLPPTNDSLYLSQISRKVFDSMRASDPEATWVMQGWLFYHDREFWGEKEIEALLSAVPDEHMIVLDLWSERYPIWKQTNAYDGKQWIWCMLHNFGQNITFSGNARSVANDPAAALHDPAAGNMRGIGLTMEGIEQNPFIYALFLENVWRDTPVDLGTFVTEYTTRRYGKTSPTAIAAWNKMLPTLYENELTNGGNESIITGRPTLKRNPEGTTNIRLHYKNRTLVEAWDGMIACADTLAASDGFRYDLTDITRQVLANYASVLQQRFVEALGRPALPAGPLAPRCPGNGHDTRGERPLRTERAQPAHDMGRQELPHRRLRLPAVVGHDGRLLRPAMGALLRGDPRGGLHDGRSRLQGIRGVEQGVGMAVDSGTRELPHRAVGRRDRGLQGGACTLPRGDAVRGVPRQPGFHADGRQGTDLIAVPCAVPTKC